VRAERGFIWAWKLGRGARNRTRTGEDSAEISKGLAVLVPNSSNGMTSGSLLSAARERGSGNDSGEGELGSWAGSGFGPNRFPPAFFSFFLFFFFCFSFEIGLKLSRTSDLNFSHTLEFVKLFFWYLNIQGRFDLRAK
jgi:hypothetical protein